MSAASQRKMKPSGIDWIGDVPEGWGIVRVKYTGWYRNGLTYAPDDVCDEDEGVLVLRSSNIQGGKLDYADSVYVNKTIPRELMTRVDDIVICSRNGSSDLIGKNAIVNDKRVMTFGAFMMTYRVESYFPRFAYWMLNSCVFKYYRSLFATSTVNQLTGADFGNITVPVPPLDEQKRIAAKLDRLCGRVDELAENIKGEIAALQEYRKSLITECVTKGLNPKAKMKPSGVDWIGDIPVGWTIMRLKYACSTITDGSHFSPECVDDGYPYVTATDVRGVGIDFERTKFVSEADYQALVAAGCGLKRDDVLIVKDGATTGRVGMMTDDTEAVALSSVAILRTPQDIDRKFLYWGLQSDGLQKNIQQTMAGSAMPRITVWKLEQYNIALPLLDEQKEIVAFLDKRCAVIDAKIAERQRQLEKLGEYRSSVIYEYVTGKREVPA